jgi:hypothetical protein
MAACATLTVVVAAVLAPLLARALWLDLLGLQVGLLHTTAFAVAMSLPVGGAIARRRMLGSVIPAQEEDR